MTLSDLEWLSRIFSDTKCRAVFLRQLSFLFGYNSVADCPISVKSCVGKQVFLQNFGNGTYTGFTSISLHLVNDTRWGDKYNGRRIGTLIQYMEWCHFEWPPVTASPDVKDALFDTEYLRNVTRYSYNGILWNLLNGAIYSDLRTLQRQITRKLYKIELYLQHQNVRRIRSRVWPVERSYYM